MGEEFYINLQDCCTRHKAKETENRIRNKNNSEVWKSWSKKNNTRDFRGRKNKRVVENERILAKEFE